MKTSTKATIGILAVIFAALVWLGVAMSTSTGPPSPNPPGGLSTRTPQVSNATVTPQRTPATQPTPTPTHILKPTATPVRTPKPASTTIPPIPTIPAPVPSAASTRVPVPVGTPK